MEQAEIKWLKSRCGYISASELHNLTIGKRGGVSQATLNYISNKRFERKRGYPILEDNRNFRMGKQFEPDAVEWLKENYTEYDWVYSLDPAEYETPPFITVEWAKFGFSPDVESRCGKVIVDIKTLTSKNTVGFFDDETIPHIKKVAIILEEHGDQIIGGFLARPKAQEFWICKYNPQIDENMLDLEPTTAQYRGQVFKFTRKEMGQSIESARLRVQMFDKFIDTKHEPDKIRGASLVIEGDKVDLIVEE